MWSIDQKDKILFNTNFDTNTANWNEWMKNKYQIYVNPTWSSLCKASILFWQFERKIKVDKNWEKNVLRGNKKSVLASFPSHRIGMKAYNYDFPFLLPSPLFMRQFHFDTFHKKKFLSYPWIRKEKKNVRKAISFFFSFLVFTQKSLRKFSVYFLNMFGKKFFFFCFFFSLWRGNFF